MSQKLAFLKNVLYKDSEMSKLGHIFYDRFRNFSLSVTCNRWWFSLGTPVSSTNKTDRHDITEILLKVALNTITLLILECGNDNSRSKQS